MIRIPVLRRRLLAWYDRSRRPLPWRRDRDPYRVLVAETMLQQTTIAAVLPRYERFLRRFPSLARLAAAPEAAVLREWAGLGYYARARNLRAAAVAAVRDGGRLPAEAEALRRLPGVGEYTAAAVASIAFGRPAAALDGNVARVLTRLAALRGDVRQPALRRRLLRRAEELLDRGRPGDWNQALMELGETLCVPRSPRCAACPVAALCAARRLGLQDRLPRLSPRPGPVALRWTCLWIEDQGQVLLWKNSEDERLLKGHWSLPRAGSVPAVTGPRLKTVSHSITKHRISLELRQGRLSGKLPKAARWTPKDRLRRFFVSSLWLKASAGL